MHLVGMIALPQIPLVDVLIANIISSCFHFLRHYLCLAFPTIILVSPPVPKSVRLFLKGESTK